jgi:hypothetical protein
MVDYDSHAYDLNTIYQKKTYDEMKDILVQNLSILCQENELLKIDGFYVETETEAVQPVSQVVAPKSVVKPTVQPSIIVPPINKPIVKPAVPKMSSTPNAFNINNSSDDDIMAMAEKCFSN